LLQLTEEQLRAVMCGEDHPELPDHLTVRHLLAAKVCLALLPMANLETAQRAGVTAGDGAQTGSNRLLVVAYPDGKPAAFWRDAEAGLSVILPFLAVPADLWFAGIIALVADHRRAAERPN
jgi:hypothetical protein